MTTALGSVKNSRLKVPPSRPIPGVADAAERGAQIADEETVNPDRSGP